MPDDHPAAFTICIRPDEFLVVAGDGEAFELARPGLQTGRVIKGETSCRSVDLRTDLKNGPDGRTDGFLIHVMQHDGERAAARKSALFVG